MDFNGAQVQSAQGHADVPEALQPRFPPNTFSKLTFSEMLQRIKEEDTLEVDLHKPESSAWLSKILKQARDKDSERQSFALLRLNAISNRMLYNKGHALCAGFAAYVLEQGILEEVIRILRAARLIGNFYQDFHVFPEMSIRNLLLSQRPFTLSRVEICFRLLHVLVLDARTARFVLKAIPDLLSTLEEAYLSSPPDVSDIRLEEPEILEELE